MGQARRQRTAAIAAALLADPDRHVILDSETTGLHGSAEIIQLAVIQLDGTVLLDSLICPVGAIPPKASQLHGIYQQHVADAPAFPEVYAQLLSIVEGKTIIVYNAGYEHARLDADCRRHDLPPLTNRWLCAMELYAEWYGEWNHYFQNYRWQPLPDSNHSALGDCRATLGVLQRMAATAREKRRRLDYDPNKP